jgi:hypothetical protein
LVTEKLASIATETIGVCRIVLGSVLVNMTQATDGHAAGVSYQHGVVQDQRVEVALIHGGEFGILEAGLAAELRARRPAPGRGRGGQRRS